jgi:hypothetical protein
MSLWEGDVTVKNISNKPIVLLVGVFDAIGPHSHGGSGFVIERFFSEAVMQPGDTFPVSAGRIRRGECCINPVREPRYPRAEFRVQFVQFLDGSTFGDDSEGGNVLASRISAVQLLQRLDDAYSKRGEHEFEAQLKREVALKEADVLILPVILDTEKAKGSNAAIAQIRAMLALAAPLGHPLVLKACDAVT